MAELFSINDHPRFARRRSVRATKPYTPTETPSWMKWCDQMGIDRTNITHEQADEIVAQYMCAILSTMNEPPSRR